MLLTYSAFQALDRQQQDCYVHLHGQFMAQRWLENYSIELYSLGSFYCERWLEQECRHLPEYRAFSTDECLAWYPSQLQQCPY